MAYEISISKKIDKTGRSELSLRLRLGQIDQQASTHLFVNPAHVRWESYLSSKGRKSKRLVITISRLKTAEVQHTVEVKERLENMLVYLDAQLQQIGPENVGRGWLASQIDLFLTPSQKPDNSEAEEDVEMPYIHSFFELYDEFLAKRNITEGSRRQYMVFRRIMERYELYKRVLEPEFRLGVDYFTENALEEINHYMKYEYRLLKKFPSIIKTVPESRTPGERGQNTVNGYFKKLRAFLMWAMNQGMIASSPFRKFKIEQDVYGTPYYITLDERHKIEQVDLSKRPALAVQRDIFVFHCCLGCRVSDLRALTSANLINGSIHYIARKTTSGHPVTIKVPLNKTAVEIVERYADPTRISLLPFISDQKYNEAIKEIFTIAGVTRNVVVRNSLTGKQEIRPINEIASSHIARRTFTGIIYKKFKDQSLVSELTGHAPGSRAFARYREIDDEMRREMVDAIE